VNPLREVTTVGVINNAISAELIRQDLHARGIPLDSVALVLLRQTTEPWIDHCAAVLRYPGRPAQGALGQWRFFGYYYAAARLLRRLERSARLQHFYLVNNENLVTTHLLAVAEDLPQVDVSVLAEGLMNFQDIEPSSRAKWRWRVKPVVARLLRFRYRQPHGHLSGAFEPRVSRVVSFADEGLKAPSEKVVIRRFEPVQPIRPSDPEVALVVLTGLNQWMAPAAYSVFAHAFVGWLEAQGFRKIQVKKHPRVSAGLIEKLLDKYEEVGRGQTTEALAAHLEAGTIVGTCCTALVTLKLIRPDLHCIDFGSDYYSEHAYHGDDSVKTLLSAAGVSLVQMPGLRQPPRASTDASG